MDVKFKAGSVRPKRFSPMKAIRYKCLDCCSGSHVEVSECNNKDCSLWEFRFGKNPSKEAVEACKYSLVFGRDEWQLWQGRSEESVHNHFRKD